jgi:hypothetical protein
VLNLKDLSFLCKGTFSANKLGLHKAEGLKHSTMPVHTDREAKRESKAYLFDFITTLSNASSASGYACIAHPQVPHCVNKRSLLLLLYHTPRTFLFPSFHILQRKCKSSLSNQQQSGIKQERAKARAWHPSIRLSPYCSQARNHSHP